MIFNEIILKKQNVNKDIIEESLQICYNNISFSTFPYIIYGLTSSSQTLDQYNSGNCIALSLFLKKYLNTMGIKSHLIPASVPKIHMVEGVNHICHVSLLIPYDKNKYFIVDPAFYFLTPIDCDENNNSLKKIDTMDIHSQIKSPLIYSITNADKYNQYKSQCTCYFQEDPSDIWHYYVQEINLEDADKYIGSLFMEKKPQPFICNTFYDSEKNTVKKLYHIKKNGDNVIIIKNNEEIYSGLYEKIPIHIYKELQRKLYKFFTRSIFI